ncbi:hypothetical protein BABINDRAFT_161713 [Babjeviella inositovora NRRL Y-12698]|uniref:Autophagy-related protein 13 n=1 Tax=Babjeviella inositovora NRRL Y-12698 TaxID=984486 RepID=A0A1E3QQW5_9ASCO|nr:uncharacterized protein BABINDRAFT_161713 [Babjeviella inositovora NRRL Y-12698]ODQ80079.1 hypothetical protein BABINDRAFT_161713 [Babjeviella inositovora NRRL Y-12698]
MWSGQDPYPPSQDATRKEADTKLRQVAHNFFLKAANVVLASRSELNAASGATRYNKWFNLEAIDGDFRFANRPILKERVRQWRPSLPSSSQGPTEAIPPMVIETYLDLREMHQHGLQLSLHHEGADIAVTKNAKKSEVVLERWLVEFDQITLEPELLPAIYKKCIVLFRGLYTYARLLPAYSLYKRLESQSSMGEPVLSESSGEPGHFLSVGCRILDGNQPINSKGRIGLSKPIIPATNKLRANETLPFHMDQYKFAPIATPGGSLRVSVSFRENCAFHITKTNARFRETDSTFAETEITRLGAATSSPIKVQLPSGHTSDSLRRFSLTSNMSVSPAYSSSPKAANRRLSTPNRIQVFKSGSVTGSPPSGGYGPGTVNHGPNDRRGSVTPVDKDRRGSVASERSVDRGDRRGSGSALDRSSSNVSLAAVLRNPRTGSVTSVNQIPQGFIPHKRPEAGIVPASLPSSACSYTSLSPDAVSGKFSSSFNYPLSRRHSYVRRRSSSVARRPAASIRSPEPGYLSTAGSDMDPASGLYVDDDIGEFVKMIDSKHDLRLIDTALSSSSLFQESNRHLGEMDFQRFQSMKSQYDDLGDKLSALLIRVSDSTRASPRLDTPPMPSIPSIMGEHRTRATPSSPKLDSVVLRGYYSLRGSPSVGASAEYAHREGSEPAAGYYSLTSEIRRKHAITSQYADVFDDEEDEPKKPPVRAREEADEDDDLLFEMSDVHLAKGSGFE